MPHFRQNFLTNEWVIIAPERAKRPDQFNKTKERKALPDYDASCPFCLGNERLTPPAITQIADGKGWRQRVVANKFAAVNPDASSERHTIGRFLSAEGFGVAEVLIENPSHDKMLATMEVQDVRNVLELYKQRCTALAEDKRIDLITIFKNHGEKAGTSLEHPHSQIIATSIVPPQVRFPMQRSLVYHDTHGDCLFCVMLQDELDSRVRIVSEGKHFVTYCPYASKSPFELNVVPKRHSSQFNYITAEELDELAIVLQSTLKKLFVGLNNPDYNFVIRSAPVSDGELHYDHWRLMIVPKLTTPAGFEIGSGIFINIMPPEDAAKFLRGVAV